MEKPKPIFLQKKTKFDEKLRLHVPSLLDDSGATETNRQGVIGKTF